MSPAPRPRPSHLPSTPHSVVTCAAPATTVHLLPVGSSVAPLPSGCCLPEMGCQRFAVVFVCEFWPQEPAGTREAPSPLLVHGKRPSSPHSSSSPLPPPVPTVPAWRELARTEPGQPLAAGYSHAPFFCILNTHTYSHTHMHTHQAPRPRQHASLLSGAAPAKKAQKRAAAESRAAER